MSKPDFKNFFLNFCGTVSYQLYVSAIAEAWYIILILKMCIKILFYCFFMDPFMYRSLMEQLCQKLYCPTKYLQVPINKLSGLAIFKLVQ